MALQDSTKDQISSLFDKVCVLCPSISTTMPEAHEAIMLEIDAVIENLHDDLLRAQEARRVVRDIKVLVEKKKPRMMFKHFKRSAFAKGP